MNPSVDFSTLFVPQICSIRYEISTSRSIFLRLQMTKTQDQILLIKKGVFFRLCMRWKIREMLFSNSFKMYRTIIQYTVYRRVRDKKQNEDERKYYCTSKPCKNHRLVSGSRYIKLKNNKLNIHQISKKLCFDEKTWHLKLKKCNDHILYFFLFTFIIYCNNCEGILFVNAQIRPHWEMYIVKLDPDPHQDIL